MDKLTKQNKGVDKKALRQKQMREMLYNKFFMFYDFLQDGFIEFAMEFYDDPFGFDVNEAKARAKKREEDDIEASAINNENDELLKKGKGASPFDITLPSKELNDRVEESFRNNSLIQDIDKNILKV